ncbi:MAG TPA: excinuclease ABC subunit B [Armatimonadetes bacterium]|nr:excinuclease ABC subunit B [Armatimonadota bacterium]
MPQFELVSDFEPMGDQGQAIDALVAGIGAGEQHQVLLGITGSGKTYVIAKVIEAVQRPTLVLAHNKTLAGQLCMEFREFFPDNAVDYFISYYDYYQPEAYLAATDTYIEKDAEINEEIERMRHAATHSLTTRRDVIVVASVSCIFGLGSPEEYKETTLELRVGGRIDRDEMLRRLVKMQFSRNDTSLPRGAFRARGDVVEVHPVDEDVITRVELFGDEVERISRIDELTGEVLEQQQATVLFPTSHFVASAERVERAMESIREEMEERVARFEQEGKLLEAQRLRQRTEYDLEMIQEIGYCQGIENYSRHLDGRRAGEPPNTLMTYFPSDFLMVVDESHQTIPQLRGMYNGDRSRKDSLVKHGFRLPSAYDNRPLTFPEWEQRVNQVIYTSATPGPWETQKASRLVECVIRPTGLLDPAIEVRPTKGQIDNLIAEIKAVVEKGQRVLVTTLTKRMAEDLSEYLAEASIKVTYLHSDIESLERTELLRDLRLGKVDVLVGINLLREGLDLPEVSLVAILDADREGFLRSETALMQTMGRAARHQEGTVIMYADTITPSMQAAIDETNRRRARQRQYNEERGIVPRTVTKAVRETLRGSLEQRASERAISAEVASVMESDDLQDVIRALEVEMRSAAEELDFERAADLRDEIRELKQMLGE